MLAGLVSFSAASVDVPPAAASAAATLPAIRRFWRSASAADTLSPPEIPAKPATRRYAGREWPDEYSWLEAGGPEVQQVLHAERQHACRWLQRCAHRANELHAAMLHEVPEEQVSVPERVGGHEYYVEQLPGAPHPRYMRRPVLGGLAADSAGAAEVVLDVNELAAVHGEYVQVGQMKLSRCGRHLAFTLEAGNGEEAFHAFTRDLTTGTLRHLGALGGVVSMEWAADDGRTLLATQPNELGRPWRVVAYAAGGGASAGSGGAWGTGGRWLGSGGGGFAAGGGPACWPVFEEGDERFFVELGSTKDWSLLTINCNSKASSEVHLLPADLSAHSIQHGSSPAQPTSGSRRSLLAPRLVQPRVSGLEYFVEHNAGQLYILSNARGAEDYAVYRVPAASPSLAQEHWQTVVHEQPRTAIEDMDMTRHWLVLYQRVQGRQQVATLPLRDGLPAVGAAQTERYAGAAAGAGMQLAAGAAVAARAGMQLAAAGAAALGAEAAGAAAQHSPEAPGQQEQQQQPSPPLLCTAPLPSWALSVVAGANADFDSPTLRLMLSSPVHHEATFDWQLGSQTLVRRAGGPAAAPASTARQRQGSSMGAAAAGGSSRDAELTWQRLWATSADGTAVPLTVAHRADLVTQRSGGSDSGGAEPGSSSSSSMGGGGGSPRPVAHKPCLLVVYGAYGHCLPTDFAPERLPLLRSGWVLALAHVRGGGELGRRWHAAGRGAAKASSIADLEACLDHLFAAGYTRPSLVALEAHSAGGLTAGALLNRRPADLGAALLEAPFVDVLSAMCQPELPLTVHEYEEWGNPQEAQQQEQIRRVCPYQNVRPAAAYPPTLLTCSLSDLRVPFWGPLKHAARLRGSIAAAAAAAGQRRGQDRPGGPILLLPDEQTGHFVHERERFTAKAQQYAFLEAAVEGRL
ncbi:hypothetical protein ABPG75_009751 [Micractinium tetrahymenae]